MDPAQFTRMDSTADGGALMDTPTSKAFQTTPVSSSKANGKPMTGAASGGGGAAAAAAAAGGAGTVVPRIDTEPIYTALKASLGEGFGAYRDAIAGFVLGKLSQAELSQSLNKLLSPAPSVSINPASSDSKDAKLTSTIHLHNQLLCALYANIFRDSPPDTVAPWVLAPDDAAGLNQHAGKTGAAGAAANEAEERLKREVMSLSARDRRRIKNIKDTTAEAEGKGSGPLAKTLLYHQALTVPTSKVDAEASLLEGKGSLAKTNWDVEIKRRYAMPLASETLEFPSRTEIQGRIEPICYEEGVGLTANTPLSTSTLQACAELVETATEMFVKEILERCISTTRTNGDLMPMTAAYKTQLHKEEDAVERGELARNAAGLLPCEVEATAHRDQLSTDDLRLSVRLDDGRLPYDAFLADNLLGDVDVDMDAWDSVPTPPDHDLHRPDSLLLNGTHHAKGAGSGKDVAVVADSGDPMVVDSDDPDGWGWTGAGQEDMDALMGVLDSALAVGY
ncbi:hypothetical protein AAFC00_001010 [Neodothiora populina]|uniref:Uncharacterized protein n=1 Tax=Neodothiora populina TaxID=2781224 RepID=A0ABR3PMG9_9PEZI